MKDKTKNTPQVLLRRALLVLMDAAIVAFSFYFALLLRADGAVDAVWWPHNRALLYENLPWIVAVYIVCFLAGGLYSVLWKYAGERDLIRLAGMIAVPTAVVYVVNRHFIHGVLFNSANCMASVLIFLFIGGSRLAWRLFLNHPLGEQLRRVPAKDPNRPVMIVGAGEAGAWAINVCKSNKEYGHAVVAVDDDPTKLNQTIHGVPVKGTLEDIPDLCKRYGIHSIIIAIPTLKGSKLNHVIDLCVSTHCAVQLLSDPQLVGSGTPQQGAFRELNPADFLSRDEVTLDTDQISGYLTGKTVLVTGGGGSIGSELCRQVMRFKPGKLLIFDIYENCAYELLMELQQKYGRDIPVTVLIGSIRDKKRLDEVFETYHPTVVFHAAAHKHVPLMEVSPAEAVKNNVLGTKNLLVSASEHDVERFVQLSTDKAVNPTSVMGCTKRICEMLIQTFAGNTDMKCVAVRFGNVLGSHGSVIPLFEAQIKKGGPVTLTDPNIERYFMTIPEAVSLVLQAGTYAKGREIYHGYRNTIYQSENKITLYNIPVFTWNTSEYGTYNVEVSVAKAGNRFGSDFWLDGIRVMQPLDETDEHADIAAQAYNQDGEANMTAVTLRQKLLSDYTEVDENGEIQWDGKTFVVFTDSNGEIKKASEYKSNGPKEEVYLDEDQSVTFSLKDWDPNTNKLYLGVKAPFGNAKVSVNGQILELKNAADCYYEISKCADISEKDGSTIATFEIKAEEGLVSATNIKVTGNAEFTIIKKQTYGKGNGYEENV